VRRVGWGLGGSVHILVINSGSSSIKFSVFVDEPPSEKSPASPRVLFTGEISGVGSPQLEFKVRDAAGQDVGNLPDPTADADPLNLLESAVLRAGVPPIDAVGYRVVHPGPRLHAHQRITSKVLDDLKHAVAFAPLHDPEAIKLIEEMMRRFPKARHYACFDTVFHQTMPAEASTYPIPVEYRKDGVRRYGFHGLSCESVVDELRTASETGGVPKRMVIAHLGSGCSVTALVDGKSVDTTMGLTPTGGVVMGTRPGDLDPGLVLYLLRQAQGDRGAASHAVEAMLNHQAGMVALSGLPNDMRAVRKASSADAQLALRIFTRSVRKAIGGFAWLLGGLDAVVFTGGIGEHDSKSRSEILGGLATNGIALDPAANEATGEALRRVSQKDSQVTVWVVPAQEDRMIAIHVGQMERTA
jgi:acetate kinase